LSESHSYTLGLSKISDWFESHNWQAFPFQKSCWDAVLSGKDGLLNAPTGSGKTFSLFLPVLIKYLSEIDSGNYKKPKVNQRLKLLWVSPLRALAKDLQQAMQHVVNELAIPWEVGRQTGDISASEKAKLRKALPEILIITPESLHLYFTRKGHENNFQNLDYIVVDEWHELLGSKRGVQVELALSRLKSIKPDLQIWGISATIGNMEEAIEVLLGTHYDPKQTAVIKANISKDIQVKAIIPEDMERFPWSGHLGLKLAPRVLEIIEQSESTLVFTNTRAQSEIWFKELLQLQPSLAGAIALHHGSLDREVRAWVEWALHQGKLKVVVCTSSLDLGVDFSPVDTVIQIGSPKGIARFLQRAGRSGHKPGAASKIWFVPTHALELIEASALRESIEKAAVDTNSLKVEERMPVIGSLDVLAQYVITIALSGPLDFRKLMKEVRACFSYQHLSIEDEQFIEKFVTVGGDSLKRYDDYKKLEYNEDGHLIIRNKQMAMRHRMSIGTISSEVSMRVKWMTGGSLGTIEEYFISRLKIGDAFWFAGRMLELVQTKEMTAYVRKTKAKKGPIPAWLGGRISFSSQMSIMVREQLTKVGNKEPLGVELKAMAPIFQVQKEWSIIPQKNELLIERSLSKEGCHVFIYPFEGRYVHEGLSALIAWRISQIRPISFSMAMNDYGFELLSDDFIPIEEYVENGIFSVSNLSQDIKQSLNNSELAKRRFRDIARVAGMLFTGFPGKAKTQRNLQMSSGLLFDVLKEYEPEHKLLTQALDEVLTDQLDEARMRAVLNRISSQTIVFKDTKRFTPFAFPIMVDRLRDKMSSEKLEDRIRKMIAQLEKGL
jgi:ATP-dependent Lhr-like helicase